MTLCTADFNAGVNGNVITISDPGSATAWDARVLNAGGALTYSNAHAISGTLSGKFGVAGSSSSNYLVWTTALGTVIDHYGRLYIWLDALDSSRTAFVSFKTAASANACSLWVNASGTLTLVDASNGAVGTTSATVSTGQWVRIEWHIIHSATVGQGEVKLFNDASSTTPTDSFTTAANKNLAADAREVHLGWELGPGTSGNTFYLDDIIVGADSYQGPVPVVYVSPNFAPVIYGRGAC